MTVYHTACSVCNYCRNLTIILGEWVLFLLAGYGLYYLVAKFFPHAFSWFYW